MIRRKNSTDSNLEDEIYSVEKMADDLQSWNLKYHAFPDIRKFIKENWHQAYGDDVIEKYLTEIMRKRSNSYWNVQPSFPTRKWDSYNLAELSWRGTKADLRGDLGYSEKTSDKYKKWLKEEKRPNPPKGSSKQFSKRFDEYYKEAFNKNIQKFPDINKSIIKKIFLLKKKDYSPREIAISSEKLLGRKINQKKISDILKIRAESYKVAWARIKHRYEKSDKSGKWILKKSK